MTLHRQVHRYLAAGTILLLSGCSAMQPLALPGPTQARSASIDAASGDLMYAASTDGKHIYVFSYPQGKLVQKITPPKGTISLQGLCSDASGNVYVTSISKGKGSGGAEGHLYEYAHGATKVRWTLNFYDAAPFGCAVDPKANTIAVSTVGLGSRNGEVWTYTPGSNYGSQYASYNTRNYFYCAYDGKGNLFVNGTGAGNEMYLDELVSGKSQMTELVLNKYVSVSGMGQLQWDGTNMTLEDLTAGAIYQLSISGSDAEIAGKTALSGWTGSALSTIAGSTVLVPTGVSQTSIGTWKYPSGGKLLKSFSSPSGVFALTISAGSRS